MSRTAFAEPQCLYKGALYLYIYPQVTPVHMCLLFVPLLNNSFTHLNSQT